jgi:hypothetical protein
MSRGSFLLQRQTRRAGTIGEEKAPWNGAFGMLRDKNSL